ncbi:MAG: hydrogen peroxide-inducible genes activator [Fimbriimonadaceae bacterium]|nr:hydrogen peroxide-inducible genes activator [Alphaproteobacteria bacterium]
MAALPTLKQLRYLVALTEEKHFGRAAETCFVTQSTLSAGIQELEALLGASLAERTKRSVLLTPLGTRLAARARSILREAEDIVLLAAAEQEPLNGELRLGVIPTVGPYLLPRVLPQIRKQYPKLKLYLREDQTGRLLEKLALGQLDAVLMALPYEMDGIDSIALGRDPFQLACPLNHPLAKRTEIESRDLADEPLMLLEEGHCLRQHALDVCALKGRNLAQGFEATSLQTLVHMVAGGLGLTMVPQIAIDAGLTDGLDIALVPFGDRNTAREIGLAWRRTSARADEFKLLGKFFELKTEVPAH